MVDTNKFADFIEKAKQNIDQIKIGLLRHDRNPKDREFLNDISKSVRSIKNSAVPLGLPRIMELCHTLESLITLIREEKKELNQEIIITIGSCKERLSKFVFELETLQMERSKVKDLVERIQQHIDDFQQAETAEAEPEAVKSEEPAEEPAAAVTARPSSSLLPEEVINKDYDRELFQIFIEQLQENLSLLRSLTDSYAGTENKENVISRCSDLLGKLQSSANYMGYERLAEFYLQWIAELEMVGVDLSMGTSSSFDFMNQKIRKIADLFPEIEDKPADLTALKKAEKPKKPPAPDAAPEAEEELAADAEFREMFGSLDEIEDEEFGEDIEPIAALSGETPPEEEDHVAEEEITPPKKREARGKKTIEIDGTFLEEERKSDDYDEELFQIFVQQLQENISKLQNLTTSFATEPGKTGIIDQCSTLVGKLQSSANYMGYERLAEFYLQWIAELEMVGVEMSIGSDVSFDFMQEKIDRISSLFPLAEGTQPTRPVGETAREEAEIAAAVEPPAPPVEKFLDEVEEEEEEEPPLAEGIEPIAGISGEAAELEEAFAPAEEEIPAEEEKGEFGIAVDEKLESFFGDEEEAGPEEEPEAPSLEIAALSDAGDEETPDGMIEPIAGITEEAGEPEKAAAPVFEELPEKGEEEAGEFLDALDEKLESFFGEISEPEGEEDIEASFMEVASLSDEEEEEPEAVAAEPPSPAGGLEELFDGEEEEEPLAEGVEPIAGISEEEEEPGEAPALFEEETVQPEEEAGEFGEAVAEKLESFFADMGEAEAGEDLETSFMDVASLSDEDLEETVTVAEEIASPPDELDEKLKFFFEDVEEEDKQPAKEAGHKAEVSEEPEAASDLLAEEEAAGFGEEVDEKLKFFFEDVGEEEQQPAVDAGHKAEVSEETEAAPDLLAEEEAGGFGEEVDEKLESFFADMEETEAKEDIETPFMDVASISDEEEQEPAAAAEEAPAPAGDLEGLFEEEGGEEEPLAEGVEPIAGVSEEEEEAEEAPALFGKETPQAEEEGVAPLGEEMLGDIDAFFEEGEPAEEEIATEPAAEEAPEEIGEEEEEVPAVPEKAPEDLEAVFEEPPEEEQPVHAEDLLSDEELLEEIEGPKVGEEAPVDVESLIGDIESADEVVSSLPEVEELSEEELFRKLEGAIDAEQMEAAEEEEPVAEEEDFDESEIPTPEVATAPERKELFQKLTRALQSLDEEAGEAEEEEMAAAPPQAEPEFDSQLFDRLAGALEKPSEKADLTGARPIDHVLEEILSGIPVRTAPAEPVSGTTGPLPKKLAASEIKKIIRMDTDKVEGLMDQVGELNASRSTLSKLFAEMKDLHQHYLETEGFSKQELKPLQDLIFRLGDTNVSLNRLSSELREGVLRVRMVPISLLFDRYHDFVSELAASAGKQVEIEINGEDTELEKTVIDDISEPLTHIIGNAVEHGIETVQERKSLGKEKTGKIRLDAYHDNNDIVIEVMDDGRGIDLKKVKAMAMQQGLFTGDELLQMSDRDLKRLILNPAFSTVTGEVRKPEDRGEGMHIVKSNIEQLDGSIDIRSKAGKGTIIQIRVPLNLLVVKALKVKAGKEVMALPVSYVEQILRVRRDEISSEDPGKFMQIDDETIPVFTLTDVFRIETVKEEDERPFVVVVKAEGQSIGLIVDDTQGLEEIVIKPIGEFLRRESGFSGATIISNGSISLVPDIAELIRIAKEDHPVPEESLA